MKHRTVLRLLAPLTVLTMFLVVTPAVQAPVARADHGATLGHWPMYRWGSPNPAAPFNAFYWIVKSTNPTLRQVVAEVAAEYNAIPEVAGSSYKLPYIGVINDVDQDCENFYFDSTGSYSFATICADDTLAMATGTAITGYWQPATHFVFWHPYTIVASLHPSYGSLKALVAHELGHVLGLGHSADCSALLRQPSCPSLTEGDTWTQHDIDALWNHYVPHGLH